MSKEGFDLEGELDAGRSRPRPEFVTSLAGDVRGRVRRSKMGLMLALCGLMIVAVASFGGIGYAAGSKPAKNNSSASAQYAPYTPKQTAQFTPKVKPKAAVKAEAAAVAPKAAPAHTSSQLPFTGLALWVPLAIGLVLIGAGVLLRTRARRQH
jgi:hypothetical protein